MAWLNLTIPNQTVKNGLKTKKIKLLQMIIFLKKQTFSFCKFFKKLFKAMRMCAIFGPKMVHLPQAFFFFWKIIKIIIIYLLAHLIVENFKTILPEDPEL